MAHWQHAVQGTLHRTVITNNLQHISAGTHTTNKRFANTHQWDNLVADNTSDRRHIDTQDWRHMVRLVQYWHKSGTHTIQGWFAHRLHMGRTAHRHPIMGGTAHERTQGKESTKDNIKTLSTHDMTLNGQPTKQHTVKVRTHATTKQK